MTTGATPPRDGKGADGGPSETDRHLAAGEAALMLVECLMLALVSRGVLELDEVLEEVETALEAKRRLCGDGSHPRLADLAAGMLTEIANSLAAGGGTRP